jgi:DNA-binding NarL/FixJ family response regulator
MALGPAAGRTLDIRLQEVLVLIAYGYSDEAIGALLGMSCAGIRSRRKRLLHRLHARNRAHAVGIAFRKRILVVEPTTSRRPHRRVSTSRVEE